MRLPLLLVALLSSSAFAKEAMLESPDQKIKIIKDVKIIKDLRCIDSTLFLCQDLLIYGSIERSK